MTDIGVFVQPFQAEDLSWDLSTADNPGFAEGGTIDVSLFTPAQHFPKGYIPSGTVLAVKTSTGLLGPYLGDATDGRETATGILRASTQVLQPTGVAKAKVGVAVLKAFTAVAVSKLPLTSVNAATGGYLDAAAQTDLKNLHFSA